MWGWNDIQSYIAIFLNTDNLDNLHTKLITKDRSTNSPGQFYV